MKGTSVRIEAPYFVAGVIVGERAAPIIKYMKDWTLLQIINRCQSKNWKYQIIPRKDISKVNEQVNELAPVEPKDGVPVFLDRRAELEREEAARKAAEAAKQAAKAKEGTTEVHNPV